MKTIGIAEIVVNKSSRIINENKESSITNMKYIYLL